MNLIMILLEDRLVLEAKDKMIMSMIKREQERELRVMKRLLVTGAAGAILDVDGGLGLGAIQD